jgi:hypothetical protein
MEKQYHSQKISKNIKKYQKILKGDHEYFLAPGTHTLIVNQWNKSDFISYNKNLRKGRTMNSTPKPLQSTVTMQILDINIINYQQVKWDLALL